MASSAKQVGHIPQDTNFLSFNLSIQLFISTPAPHHYVNTLPSLRGWQYLYNTVETTPSSNDNSEGLPHCTGMAGRQVKQNYQSLVALNCLCSVNQHVTCWFPQIPTKLLPISQAMSPKVPVSGMIDTAINVCSSSDSTLRVETSWFKRYDYSILIWERVQTIA